MRRLIGLVVLAVGLGVLAATDFAPAGAQDKDPKAKKMKDKKEPAAGGTVEIYKAKDGYRFRVKDAAGKTLAIPPRAHDTQDEVLKDIEAIKAILARSKPAVAKD